VCVCVCAPCEATNKENKQKKKSNTTRALATGVFERSTDARDNGNVADCVSERESGEGGGGDRRRYLLMTFEYLSSKT
jgi:hypothetical protein